MTATNEAEIWRYQIDVDDWSPVRVADQLDHRALGLLVAPTARV